MKLNTYEYKNDEYLKNNLLETKPKYFDSLSIPMKAKIQQYVTRIQEGRMDKE